MFTYADTFEPARTWKHPHKYHFSELRDPTFLFLVDTIPFLKCNKIFQSFEKWERIKLTNSPQMTISVSVHCGGAWISSLFNFLGKFPEEVNSQITWLHIYQSKWCLATFIPHSFQCLYSCLSKLWLKGGEPFQLLQKFPKFDNAMNGQTTWERKTPLSFAQWVLQRTSSAKH